MVKSFFKRLRAFLARILMKNVDAAPSPILKNVFKTSFSQKILISYIKWPFTHGIQYHHTNLLECYTAAEIFNNLGYEVDVVNFNEEVNVNFADYKAIYGFGITMENSFFIDEVQSIKRIFYGTGCNSIFANKQMIDRLHHFYSEKGFYIPASTRSVNYFWPFQQSFSDLVISLGNSFVKNTYLEMDPQANVESLNIFHFDTYDIDLSKKNFSLAKKHFLWFGSAGLIHKGLDLVIDVFSKQDDIVLHICGAAKSEYAFFKHYQETIDNASNIIDHGFIDITSSEFKELMDTCGFIITPSVSEGGAAATLNVMANGGLIPIITESTGLDIEGLGYTLESLDKESIRKSISHYQQLDTEHIKEKSFAVKTSTREIYSFDNYKMNLTRLIESVISKH